MRPGSTRFSPEIAQRICEMLAEGKSLTAICRDPAMPNKTTVGRWLADPANAAFRQAYDAARLAWADHLFETIVELGEEARQAAADADARGANSNAAVAAIREEIRAKMWVCARLRPDKYGDRISAEVTGANGAPLIPENREARLPQLVAVLALLLPGRDNSELFDLASTMLDKVAQPAALPVPENGDDR